MKDVYILVDHFRGELNSITLELLGKGKELAAKTGGSCIALLLGSNAEGLAPQLGAANKVVYLQAPALEHFITGNYVAALNGYLAGKDNWLLLIGSTSGGLDVANLVAHANHAALVVNCKALAIAGDKLLATTQMYAAKVLADVEAAGSKIVAMALPGAFPEDAGKAAGTPAIEKIASTGDFAASKMTFVEYLLPEAGDIDITRQDVLVSIGRGVQSDNNIAAVQELADALGGVLAASRPVVDQGWLPLTRQVGKSGMSVKPKLYLALGISGAPEHTEGMKNSELIVAVNSDANAPIFNFAHYGIVADMMDVVEALTEAVKA